MKISLSWLQDYVTIDMPVDRLAHLLTMVGLEVESIEERYAYLDTVVVGRISEVAAHPNADKLKVCQVEAGSNTYQVVCGAPNAAVGMLAPLALGGTLLPEGTVVTKNVLRGQISEGMLCSQSELHLGPDGAGLMVLSADLPESP